MTTTMTAPVFNAKGLPPYIRDMRSAPNPYSLMAYGFLRNESLLRQMCFLDNTFGQARAQDVHILSSRIVGDVNKIFADQHRKFRIFGVSPNRGRHHRVEVHWCYIDDTCSCLDSMQKLIINLYPLSKRAHAEEEDDECSEPMRGSPNGAVHRAPLLKSKSRRRQLAAV